MYPDTKYTRNFLNLKKYLYTLGYKEHFKRTIYMSSYTEDTRYILNVNVSLILRIQGTF